MRVFENADLPLEFDEKTDFVGTLKKGEDGVAIFNFDVDNSADAKTYNIKVQVRTVNRNNVLVSEYTVPLTIGEKEGGPIGLMLGLIVLIVLVIIIIIVLSIARKKRKSVSKRIQ